MHCSLNKNFDDLQHLLSFTKTKFDIIAISETSTTKQVTLLNNLDLIWMYSNWDFCRWYIANHLSYKYRNDLNIYKKWTWIYFYWNCQSKKWNVFVGVIYRHPSMNLFPQINIIMKPQVLHKVTSQNFFIKQIDIGSIQSL